MTVSGKSGTRGCSAAHGRSETDAVADGRRCGERLHSGWTRGRSRPNADEGSATVNALRCSGNAFVALAEAHASGIHFVL